LRDSFLQKLEVVERSGMTPLQESIALDLGISEFNRGVQIGFTIGATITGLLVIFALAVR